MAPTAPAVPLPSASVILVDPARGGEEPFGLFLLKRRQKSSFMPNRFVFPGGRVEGHDGGDPWSGQALKTCALRELWEEAGVVLALGRGAHPPQAELERARRALLDGGISLARVLAGLGLAPDAGALLPYARWITPTARPQRFDTVFYVALMPAGQEASSDQTETSQGLWLGPRRALAENVQGQVELAPPQVIILGHLASLSGIEQLLAHCQAPDLSPVMPVLWAQGRGPEAPRVILLPGDPDYPAGAPADPDHPGEPCPAVSASRLVHQGGVWIPHRPW